MEFIIVWILCLLLAIAVILSYLIGSYYKDQDNFYNLYMALYDVKYLAAYNEANFKMYLSIFGLLATAGLFCFILLSTINF